MPNPKVGITPLPDGSEIHWNREEVTPEAAALFRRQAKAKRSRVVSLTEQEDGTFVVHHHHDEVPGEWLHAFLYDCEDGPGEGETVLSVAVIGAGRALPLIMLCQRGRRPPSGPSPSSFA